jgi:hypothetical protein
MRTDRPQFHQPNRNKRPRTGTTKSDEADRRHEAAVNAFQDSAALLRGLLGSWAWHPRCPTPRHDEVAPKEFGDARTPLADMIAKYKSTFAPYIVDEAAASLQKDYQDEVKHRRVFPVQVASVAETRDGRADVQCVLLSNFGQDAKKGLKDGNVVFLTSRDPSAQRFGALQDVTDPRHGGGAAALAGTVKMAGRSDRDPMLLEMQLAYAPAAAQQCESAVHAAPGHHAVADAAAEALRRAPRAFAPPPAAARGFAAKGGSGAAGAGPPLPAGTWFLVAAAPPTTAQREMAGLQAICRHSIFRTLAAPSAVLARQGGEVYEAWPPEVCGGIFCSAALQSCGYLAVLLRPLILQVIAAFCCALVYTNLYHRLAGDGDVRAGRGPSRPEHADETLAKSCVLPAGPLPRRAWAPCSHDVLCRAVGGQGSVPR